jgi:hypothetical protein
MQYKVVPFVGSINQTKEPAKVVAEQLESMINHHAEQGWNYVRLESVISFVNPVSGCFGFGDKPGYNTTKQMVVFSKS